MSSLHLRPRFLVSALFAAAGFSATLAVAAGPLPALPGPGVTPGTGAAVAAPAAAAAAPIPDAGSLADHMKRGVVLVEQGGRPVSVGTVLANDGRILTALSPLGTSDAAEVRYSDGHTVKARIGHREAAWDLALLIPLSGRWTDGLMASEADPAGIELRVLSPRAPKGGTPAALKGRVEAKSKDGDPLSDALDVDLKGAPVQAGAPIVDATGSVVGMLVRACKASDGGACAPLVVGAPVAALRNFLVRTPMNAVPPAPWLGIVAAPDTSASLRGARVMQVAPGSPAEKAGLRPGADIIAAVDGAPVTSPEQLAEQIAKHAVGEGVKFLVFGDDKFRELTVVLRAAP